MKITKLSIHKTYLPDKSENGVLVPIWKQSESDFSPKQAYFLTINKGFVKGPYGHSQTRQFLVLLQGEAVIVHRQPSSSSFLEDELSFPVLLDIPFAHEYALFGKTDCSFINFRSMEWTPGDPDRINPNFSAYDFDKLKQKYGDKK